MKLVFPIHRGSSTPVYRQVFEELKHLIESGRLLPGTRLPSSRELSECLNVSRCTVSQAYADLSSHGYVLSRSKSGTYVADRIATKESVISHNHQSVRQDDLSGDGQRLMSSAILQRLDAEIFEELNFSTSYGSFLPVDKWFACLAKVRQMLAARQVSLNRDVFGGENLRESLRRYLVRTKGIDCRVEQIAVFSSSQIALETIARLLIKSNSRCLVENPGFPGFQRSVLACNGCLIPVDVDLHGVRVEDIEEFDGDLVYVSPNKQSPLGVRMSDTRRQALLGWAANHSAVIVEDDFDSEFHFTGNPRLSLKSEDRNDSVIYLSSFWTTLYPLSKIGFAVLPAYLVEPFRRAKCIMDRNAGLVEEETLALMISSDQLDRHIRKVKPILQKNRATMISALSRVFGPLVRVTPSASGTTMVLDFCERLDMTSILTGARTAGLPLASTRAYYLGESQASISNQFLVSFLCIDPERIESQLSVLMDSLVYES